MREINVPLDSAKNRSRKLISAAALYGNKVHIQVPIYKDGLKTKFYDRQLLVDIKPLRQEGIITVNNVDLSSISNRERNEMVSTIWNAEGFKELYSEYGFLYKGAAYSPSFKEGLNDLQSELTQFDSAKKDEYIRKFLEINMVGLEVKQENKYVGAYLLEEMEKMRNLSGTDFKKALINNIVRLQKRMKPSYRLQASDVLGSRRFEDLTMLQLKMFYDLIAQGKSVLANDLLKTVLREVNSKSTPTAFIPEAVELLMPRYHELNFENIIELREKANDELIEMREYIDNLSIEFAPDDINSENAKLHLKRKINPSIRQLESKVRSLNIGTLQRALVALKDPKSYTPLLATIIPDIPAVLGIGVTVGLVATDICLEHLKQKVEIKAHPLYFSLCLKAKSKKMLSK